MKRVTIEPRFESWQAAARPLLALRVPPDDIVWDDKSGTMPLPDSRADAPGVAAAPIAIPRGFIESARIAAAHRELERWDLLYRMAFRLVHENRNLLEIEVDDDVSRFRKLCQAVRRDIHKMHAFVRFRRVEDPDRGEVFVAWYRPDHRILELAAPFFEERFRNMRWSILTPDASAHWNLEELEFSGGVSRLDAPHGDELDVLWRQYYASIFNPARLNLKAMRAEMPSRFWSSMPESTLLPQLMGGASSRVSAMLSEQRAAPSAEPFIPDGATLDQLRAAAAICRGCDLHAPATQTVFGEGPATGGMMLIGEQPGDVEDRSGHPFDGPAGKVLDRALADAGLDRAHLYVTNAVKHFAFTERGKHRIHRTPRMIEVAACRPWVEREVALVRPAVVVLLGSTAAKSIFGAQFRITTERGQFRATRWCARTIATYHPSAVLRAGDPSSSDAIYALLVADLRRASMALSESQQ